MQTILTSFSYDLKRTNYFICIFIVYSMYSMYSYFDIVQETFLKKYFFENDFSFCQINIKCRVKLYTIHGQPTLYDINRRGKLGGGGDHKINFIKYLSSSQPYTI